MAREFPDPPICQRIRIVLAPSGRVWCADWAAGTRARPYRMLCKRVAGRTNSGNRLTELGFPSPDDLSPAGSQTQQACAGARTLGD